jgi:hypothetical protein
MDGANLGVLIVVSVSVIGLIQLFTWVVLLIKTPSFNYMRLERNPVVPSDRASKPRRS